MKHLLITIAAVVLVGCCTPAPGISIHDAVKEGKIDVVKQRLEAGTDVNAKINGGETPLDWAIKRKHTETADLLRKHGGKTGVELKAEGK